MTTLAGIHLALPRYIRALVDGSMLTFEQIAAVSAHLAGLDFAGRAANPCIGRERADLVSADARSSTRSAPRGPSVGYGSPIGVCAKASSLI